MVRLSPRTLRQAFRENPLLPILLRSCRDLSSARNELRWLHEGLKESLHLSKDGGVYGKSDSDRLRKLCIERGKGVPLQYILGTQPFGDLDIKCRPGVLIPRPETEAWTTHLAESITKGSTTEKAVSLNVSFERTASLSILDLCSGSGCVTLLLHALLSSHYPNLQLLGVEVSQTAVELAFSNLHSGAKAKKLHWRAVNQVHFIRSDILQDDGAADSQRDILVANPPYISPRGFIRDTSASVRRYEPRRALVPPNDVLSAAGSEGTTDTDQDIGDAFYPRLLDIAKGVSAKLVVLEVADMNQAKRVVALALERNTCAECEIWRDWPSQTPSKHETILLRENLVRVVGQGNGRAVAIKTNDRSSSSGRLITASKLPIHRG